MDIRIIPVLAPGEKWISNEMFLSHTVEKWIYGLKWPFKRDKENSVSEEQSRCGCGRAMTSVASFFFFKKSHTWFNVLLSPSRNSFFFSWLCRAACGILVPQPGIEPMPPAAEAQSPNHWTTREFPLLLLFSHPSDWLVFITPRTLEGLPGAQIGTCRRVRLSHAKTFWSIVSPKLSPRLTLPSLLNPNPQGPGLEWESQA